MKELWSQDNLVYFFLAALVIFATVQTYVLMRIRDLMHAMSMNFDSMAYYFRKSNAPAKSANPVKSNANTLRTCQFCKHRLAYINTSKGENEEEDFYHVCGLRNVNVSTGDSCENFEYDNSGNI